MEIWNRYSEMYSVSDLGRFWSVNVGIMKTPLMNTGYPHLNFMINKKQTRQMCHVVVANLFIPNPEKKRCINHKNGIKYDNRVENLEWVTHSENNIHAYDVLGKRGAVNKHRQNTIRAIKNDQVIEAKGIRAMARMLKIPYQGVQNGVRQGNLKYKGWQFELIDDPKFVSKSGIKY